MPDIAAKNIQTKTRISAIDRHIARNLKALRLNKGVSMEGVAQMLGVTYQQVQKYESGRNRVPVAMLHRLKNFFDVSYEEFFDGLTPEGPATDHGPDIHTMKLCQRLALIDDPATQRRARRVLQALLAE